MPDLTHAQLAALANTGATNREIVATLGRDMTAAERAAVDRARTVAKLTRRTKAKNGEGKSNADRQAEFVARRSEIGELPVVADPARREACRLDLLRFALAYCLGTGAGCMIKRPPSVRMMLYLVALQDCVLHDRLVHVRFPRG